MPITREETEFGPGGYGASAPNVPAVPAFVSNASQTITFSFGANGNSSGVEYAILVDEDAGSDTWYLDTDGSDGGDSEIWQDLAAWGATIAATGVDYADYSAYKFKVKARNEDGSQTSDFSAFSAVMNTLPSLAAGETSENLEREVTPGNTKVELATVAVLPGDNNYATEDEDSFYGGITITYSLLNYDSTASRILAEYSEDGGDNWDPCTKGTGGDEITALTTSPTGVEHTFVWDSYTDAGTSELDLTTLLRITAYDVSPSGGDPSNAVESENFGVNNRPGKITWENEDEREWDEDTTPTFIAVIPSFRGGTKGFPTIHVYDDALGASPVFHALSYEDIDGWWYEDSPASWNALTVAGIPNTAPDATNRMKLITPAGDALSTGDYYITGEMYEPVDTG